MLEKLTTYRRALHQIPELGADLPKTKAFLEGVLRPLPCKLFYPGGDALCAFFDAGKEDTFAFRSDMDALPICEKNALPFCSRHPNAMHACGHDGHMAILLCLAEYLAEHFRALPHNVLLVFQPAEETTGGAKDICESGIFEQLNARCIFGLHLWPSPVSYTHLSPSVFPSTGRTFCSASPKRTFRTSVPLCKSSSPSCETPMQMPESAPAVTSFPCR